MLNWPSNLWAYCLFCDWSRLYSNADDVIEEIDMNLKKRTKTIHYTKDPRYIDILAEENKAKDRARPLWLKIRDIIIPPIKIHWEVQRPNRLDPNLNWYDPSKPDVEVKKTWWNFRRKPKGV